MSRKPATPKGGSTQYVYESVRERIINMVLLPGASIDEATLVNLFRVSRTPIREALIRLASEGLVVMLPNRGAQVAALSIDTIRDYIEAMDVCQRAVFCLAAVRRQPEDLLAIDGRLEEFEAAAAGRDSKAMTVSNHDFHFAIGTACHNVYLGRAYKHLLTDSLRLSRITLSHELFSSEKAFSDYVDEIITEHRQISEAIAARDVDTAETLGRSHVEIARKRFVEYLSPTSTGSLKVRVPAARKIEAANHFK